jgi:hypothetical protein
MGRVNQDARCLDRRWPIEPAMEEQNCLALQPCLTHARQKVASAPFYGVLFFWWQEYLLQSSVSRGQELFSA